MIIILTKVVKYHYIQQGKNIRHNTEENRRKYFKALLFGESKQVRMILHFGYYLL